MKHPYALRGKLRSKRALVLVPFLLGYAVACGDDKPDSGYYLRGRVFNGASMDPVAKAELTLIAGQDTQHVVSDADGNYQVGPIQPNAGYRLDATADGMDGFEFTGAALPALDAAINDRTLIGDVPLYEAKKTSPAFKVMVKSNDERMPASVASIDFIPMIVGQDPGKAEEAPMADVPTVIGAFAEPAGATLPNHAHKDALAFHTSVAGGVAQIPEGKLSWGSTYQVSVDAGPDFLPLQFMLTPVRDNDIEVVLQTTVDFPTELPHDNQEYFTGRIYNGVTLERVTGYEMRLEYFDRVLKATVDADGRYVVGPLLPNADYTIVVKADGFRSFLSHNAKIAIDSEASISSLYYDAFVYPSEVKAPAVQVRFSLENDTKLPSGTVRFSPNGPSSLFDSTAEMPVGIEASAGVARQVWTNDEDRQQRAVVRDFTDGKLDVAEGDFVLGVAYTVSVFGVPNFGILSGGTFTAGVDANPSFMLSHLDQTPLAMVSMSTQSNPLSSNGSVEIRFNHDIVADPTKDQMVAQRSVNDGLSFFSPDKDADGEFNVLVDPSTLTAPIAPNYRGVSWDISGDRLTLRWDRERGLSMGDTGDPIVSVTYGNLSAISLYTGTLQTGAPKSLATLLGTSAITVQMTAN
jgi:hypothetical protein